MASDYRVAIGHGVALGSLNIVTPQPMGRPIRPTQRTYGLTGVPNDMASFTEWLFGDVWPDTTAYVALLTQFGLHNATTAAVTIYTRKNRLEYARYNALAILPNPGEDGDWQNYFMRGVVIVLRNLEQL